MRILWNIICLIWWVAIWIGASMGISLAGLIDPDYLWVQILGLKIFFGCLAAAFITGTVMAYIEKQNWKKSTENF